MYKTTDFKLQFLGIIPRLEDKTGILTPEQIVALSALLTFKGKSVKELLKETIEKGQDLDKKVRGILSKSSLRGHASIATTPCLAFTYEASKFVDSMMTGIVFSSSLMASGRRTGTAPEDIVFPTEIWKNKKAREIYQKQSKANISCFNWLLDNTVSKDEASKILQYGIYGTGILALPVESLVGFAREYELEKEWMPEEAGIILKSLKKHLDGWGIKQLFSSRLVAPRDIYPYPNIFKNPRPSNLTRESSKSRTVLKKLDETSKIMDCQIMATKELRQKLRRLNQLTKRITKDKKRILKDWPKLWQLRRQIARDYNLAAQVQVWSSVAWRVWGDKKRHRTVPQIVESIYYCIERAWKVVRKLKIKNENFKIAIKNSPAPFGAGQAKFNHLAMKPFSHEVIDEIDSVFSIPPTVRRHPHFLKRYLQCAFASLTCYQSLVKSGIKPRDAVFIVPRGLRIDVLQSYNLYNLISGYYPLRLCSTVEEQLRSFTIKEVLAIKNILKKKKFPELAEAIAVTCQQTGFCHEEKFCGQIKAKVKDYDGEFHREVLESLQERYNKIVSNHSCHPDRSGGIF